MPSQSRPRKLYCCPCWPSRAKATSAPAGAAASAGREKASLLSQYGIDELSDTDGESDVPENPMSPQQIAMMRACHTATDFFFLARAALRFAPTNFSSVCSGFAQSTGRLRSHASWTLTSRAPRLLRPRGVTPDSCIRDSSHAPRAGSAPVLVSFHYQRAQKSVQRARGVPCALQFMR